jgi:tRNA G46 methylase TrmB
VTEVPHCDFTTPPPTNKRRTKIGEFTVLTTLPLNLESPQHYFIREFDLAQVPWPRTVDTGHWGGTSDVPLDLEIGCGVGWHPIRYANENPGRRLIAIEQTRAKFERFRSRLNAHSELDNLHPVHANAIHWIAHKLGPDSIERCFLLYPNPEPKAPNRRWMRSPFMHHLLKTIRRGGMLTLASNERWYIDEACEWAERFWKLKLSTITEFNRASEPDFLARTHFEKKYLARGQSCFNVQWCIGEGNL